MKVLAAVVVIPMATMGLAATAEAKGPPEKAAAKMCLNVGKNDLVHQATFVPFAYTYEGKDYASWTCNVVTPADPENRDVPPTQQPRAVSKMTKVCQKQGWTLRPPVVVPSMVPAGWNWAVRCHRP